MTNDQRRVLVFTVISTLVALAYLFIVTGDWATVLVSLPFVMSVAYLSIKLTNRISRRFAPKPPEPPPPIEPTTERPDHARRRRERRRRRTSRPRRE